jgi:hypothetical protein
VGKPRAGEEEEVEEECAANKVQLAEDQGKPRNFSYTD